MVDPSTAANFSLENCWDCPTHLTGVLVNYAIFVAIAVSGVLLQRTRWRVVQLLGFLATVFAVLVAAMMTGVAPRWGMWMPGQPLRTFARPVVWTIYGSLDALLVAATVIAWLRTTPSSPSD